MELTHKALQKIIKESVDNLNDWLKDPVCIIPFSKHLKIQEIKNKYKEYKIEVTSSPYIPIICVEVYKIKKNGIKSKKYYKRFYI